MVIDQWYYWSVIPFGTKDNGGDLVETSFLVAGMITVREYFKTEQPKKKRQ
jgi:hypothetical protein